MDEGNPLSYVVLLFLLIMAAYFAVAETAFASVSRIKLKPAFDRGDKRAVRAMKVLDNFDTAITTILIGTNIVHLAAASYVTVLVTRKWGISAVAISTVITTLVVFFVGEMLPKCIAKKYSERFSLATAGSLCFFMLIFTPISKLLSAFGNAVAALTKGDSAVTVTEDELYDIIEALKDEGELGDERSDLVHSALMFADVTVESIVTSRVDLVALDVEDSCEEILDAIRAAKHSRLPVYQGSVDNIIGVLQIRKYIKAYLREGDSLQIRPLLDEAYFVHQSTNIDELLPEMSRKKLNMAIVTDNYGGTLGIVTIEDILEELVGEIWDEDDEIEETFSEQPDGSFVLSAELDIEEAFEQMEYDDPEDTDWEHKLLGEWAYEQFELLPHEGDKFRYHNLEVTISGMEHNRITRLTARILPAETEEGGDVE
jgi:CBS domain containing-hemolysin-like protein